MNEQTARSTLNIELKIKEVMESSSEIGKRGY